MKLLKIDFRFLDGYVVWRLCEKDTAPLYTGQVEKYKGKRYKWNIHAVYKGYSLSWHSFLSPTPASARRMLQNIKSDIKSQANGPAETAGV